MKNKIISIFILTFITSSLFACGQTEIYQDNSQINFQQNVQTQNIKDGFYSTGLLKIKNKSEINKTLTALKQLKMETVKEAGYIEFVVQQDKNDPQTIIIWEHFKTEADFQLHLKSDHLQSFLGLGLVEFVKGYSGKIIA